MRESWRLIWLENIKKYVIMLKIEIDRTMRKDEVQWQTQLLQLQWKMEMNQGGIISTDCSKHSE